MDKRHKCFISYKSEDIGYKIEISDLFAQRNIGVIDKSLDYRIQSDDPDYIMQKIREDYLSDSTVTVFLIGKHSSELEGEDAEGNRNNYFIEHELQASLFNGKENTRNGIVGVVLPEMKDMIFRGSFTCATCGRQHKIVKIDDSTVIREFSVNYYIKPHEGCAWSDDERYCVLVTYEDFIQNPEEYIDIAFDKRSLKIAEKVKIRDLR